MLIYKCILNKIVIRNDYKFIWWYIKIWNSILFVLLFYKKIKMWEWIKKKYYKVVKYYNIIYY